MPDVAVPMDDRELMQAAMTDTPQEAPQEQPQEQRSEPDRPRDDKGRYVARAETPEQPQVEQAPQQQAPTDEGKDDQSGHVPAWRLREIREARDAADARAREFEQRLFSTNGQMAELQRQLAEFQQPKVEPVDFFQNPDDAFKQRISPLEQRLQSAENRLIVRASRAEAVAEHGRAAVAEMETALGKAMQSGNPAVNALRAQMAASEHPVGVAMDWYKQNSLYERTGGDLDGYVQKQLDERLKDPEFLAKAVELARVQASGGQSRPKVQLPPSLNKAAGSGGNPTTTEPNDMSDASLYQYATAPGKR